MKGTTLRISKIHKRNENFNISGDIDTSGVSIDADLAKVHSERVVEYAKKLKAKNGTKYSDEYYLSMAKSIDNREMRGAYSEVFHKKAALCPIQDPQWAGYSYEEIIQMENSGYKIPEEVLLWAHAQQESDVVAYQIISDETNLDDNSSTEEITGDNSINNIQKTAKEYVNKADNAQKDNLLKIEEFQKTVDKAQEIKKERENSYKNSIQEVTKLSDELKQLETKNKNKTLSQAEESRYNELRKILNNSNNNTMQQLQTDTDELDELLSSMDKLNSEATENIQLSQNTLKAAEALSKLGRNYNDNMATHSTKGIVCQNSGLLNDILYGVNTTAIQKVALDTGTALETNTNDIISKINSDENIKLANFAYEYTEAAEKTEQATQNTTDNNNEVNSKTNNSLEVISSEKRISERNNKKNRIKNQNKKQSSTSTTNNTNKNSDNEASEDIKDDYGKNKDFFVLPVGGRPTVAIAATITSGISTANLKDKQSTVNETDELLQKNLKKSQDNIKKLNQEITAAEKKHQENLKQAELYSTQLEALDAKALEEIQKTQQNKTKRKQQEDTTDEHQIAPANTQQPYQAETDAINLQLTSLAKEDNQLLAKIKTPMNRSNADVLRDQKGNALLNNQNIQLTERTKNNKKISINTIICGVMTVAAGTWNMVKAVPLLSFPLTHAIGAALATYAGIQLGTGAGATAAGSIGVATSNDASDEIKSHNKNINDASKTILENRKAITKGNKTMNNIKSIATPTLASDKNPNSTTQIPNNENLNNNKPQNNILGDNLSTSRTQIKTFETIKDINNIPTGPTNLSEPLNSTNNNKQQNNQNMQETENTEQKNKQIITTSNNIPAINTNSKNIPSVKNNEEAKNQDKISAEKTNNSKESINAQLKTIQNKNSSLENEPEDKIGEIIKNNIEKSQILQNQFASLNNIQSRNNDDSTDNIITIKDDSNDISSLAASIITSGNNNLNNSISQNNQEAEDASEETTILAAAVTTNANINNSTSTDDKEDRKLSRFNMDSIIESKKKMKKVTAVSAARGGKT